MRIRPHSSQLAKRFIQEKRFIRLSQIFAKKRPIVHEHNNNLATNQFVAFADQDDYQPEDLGMDVCQGKTAIDDEARQSQVPATKKL